MKHGSFKAICLFFWIFVVVFSTYGQAQGPRRMESVVLERFMGDSEFVWETVANRFIHQAVDVPFPRLAYVDAWPVGAFGQNRDGSQILRSLGIHARFDRRGHNWIDLFPTDPANPGVPVEIPVPGRAQTFDVWVWGGNYHLVMDAYVRDHNGMVHSLRLGNLNFPGWRNLHVNVPATISQTRRTLPLTASLTFVKFRIWTLPSERVNDIFVYLSRFNVLTDVSEVYFDGFDLAGPQAVQEFWADFN